MKIVLISRVNTVFYIIESPRPNSIIKWWTKKSDSESGTTLKIKNVNGYEILSTEYDIRHFQYDPGL